MLGKLKDRSWNVGGVLLSSWWEVHFVCGCMYVCQSFGFKGYKHQGWGGVVCNVNLNCKLCCLFSFQSSWWNHVIMRRGGGDEPWAKLWQVKLPFRKSVECAAYEVNVFSIFFLAMTSCSFFQFLMCLGPHQLHRWNVFADTRSSMHRMECL